MRMILLESNLDVDATTDEKYELIIEISKGTLNIEQIREWITLRLTKNVP